MILAETNITEALPLQTYANVKPPNNKPAAVLWGAGNVLAPTNALIWQFTGWNPPDPRKNHQVATVPGVNGVTAIQGWDQHVGIHLHTPTVSGIPQRFGLATIVYGITFGGKGAPRPFADGQIVRSSFDIIVPNVGFGTQTNEQVVYYYSFIDTVQKKGIWVGLPIFDRRGFPAQYMVDRETQMPIIMIGGQPHYSQTFTSWQSYVFSVRWAEIASYLGGDPANVILGMAGIQFETHTPAGQWARIGGTMRRWKVEKINV